MGQLCPNLQRGGSDQRRHPLVHSLGSGALADVYFYIDCSILLPSALSWPPRLHMDRLADLRRTESRDGNRRIYRLLSACCSLRT